MSPRVRKTSANLARLALLGFALGPTLERKARAYYALAIAVVTGTTTTGAATTAGVIVLVVWLVRENASDQPTVEGATTRSLIDSAVVSTEGDLGVQIQLLSESPTAFAQLDREMATGVGPALDAMVRATKLPAEELAKCWSAARATVGVVESPEQAASVVTHFLVQISPELKVGREPSADLAWQLVRERSAPNYPEDARTHVWLAEWLGVPVEAVGEASEQALASLPTLVGQEPRVFLYANPDAYLDAFSASLESKHKAEVDARVATLMQDTAERLPEDLRQSLWASARP